MNNLYEAWTPPPTFSSLFQSHMLVDLLAVPTSSSWGAKCMLSGPPAPHNTDVHEGVHTAEESTGKSTADNIIIENTQQKFIIDKSK